MQKRNRRKKKKLKYRRLYRLIFIIIVIIITLHLLLKPKSSQDVTIPLASSNTISNTTIITQKPEKEPIPATTIPGQIPIENADGYTTIFETSHENPKKYIEYKQISGSWAENSYWGGTMAENGCGITSLSIIASGYNLNLTPEYFRDKYYPHLDATKIENVLEDLGIECSEFYFSTAHLNVKNIKEWLESGRPILICVDSSRENIWTAASHYMVLLDVDAKGKLYLSNPNGEDGTEKASGWYSPNDILPFVAKAAFIESY